MAILQPHLLTRCPADYFPGGFNTPAPQGRYLEELKTNGSEWRVTDFITLGSPLAHATILLAHDAADLGRKQEAREFPRCLPALETV